MTAIVSSIGTLSCWRRAVRAPLSQPQSNACATPSRQLAHLAATILVSGACLATEAQAQEAPPPPTQISRAASAGLFLGGAASAFAAHEAGHLLFDVIFDADPGIGKVDFHGIPFFAITHRGDLPRKQELVISSAGFWVQHAGSEWILTSRPDLRWRRAPYLKGALAFNVLASVAYSGAAFAKTGPAERDTRGIAVSAGIDERWVGAMVLAPAALDAWRYYHPTDRWAVWASRAAKVGMVLLVFK